MQKVALVLLSIFSVVSLSFAFGDSSKPGFINPVKVSTFGDNSTTTQLLVSGKNVYLAWIDNSAGKFGARLAKSNDGGTSFAKEIDLGNVNGAPDNIRIAEFQGNVYSVWQSFLENRSSIVFVKSTDNGTSFSSPIRVSETSKDSAFPQLAVYENNVYIAWLERTASDITNILYTKSNDGGVTFGTPVAITSHRGNSGIPKIYATSDHVYLMWEDNGAKDFDVFLVTSSDSGSTFSAPVNISNSTGNSGTPQMAIIGNNIYAVWMDDSSGNFDIFFSKSTDGGHTFAKPVNLSTDAQDSGYPQLAVVNNNVYVTWTNGVTDKNYDVFFSKSTDGGQTFSQPMNVSNNPGASGWPQIAVDGNVYISWVDNTPGHFDVYIAKSTDNGNSFESPVDVNSDTYGSWYNTMSVSSNTVYLAWQEIGNGSNDIMFSKSTTYVPEFGPLASLALLVSVVSVIMISQRSTLRL